MHPRLLLNVSENIYKRVRTSVLFTFFWNWNENPFFFCLASTAIQYKGCAYTYADGCNLPLNPNIAYAVIKRDCKQCGDTDGCNPADRIDIEVMTVFAAVIIASFLRYLWH